MAMMKKAVAKPKAAAKPKPKPTVKTKAKTKATPKSRGPVFVFPDGSTVGVKDIGKVKPTPKPVKPKPLPTISDEEYFRRQKEYIASQKKAKKK